MILGVRALITNHNIFANFHEYRNQVDQREPHGHGHEPKRRGDIPRTGRTQRRATLLPRGVAVSECSAQQISSEWKDGGLGERNCVCSSKPSPFVKVSTFPVTFSEERLRNGVEGRILHQNKPKQNKSKRKKKI